MNTIETETLTITDRRTPGETERVFTAAEIEQFVRDSEGTLLNRCKLYAVADSSPLRAALEDEAITSDMLTYEPETNTVCADRTTAAGGPKDRLIEQSRCAFVNHADHLSLWLPEAHRWNVTDATNQCEFLEKLASLLASDKTYFDPPEDLPPHLKTPYYSLLVMTCLWNAPLQKRKAMLRRFGLSTSDVGVEVLSRESLRDAFSDLPDPLKPDRKRDALVRELRDGLGDLAPTGTDAQLLEFCRVSEEAMTEDIRARQIPWEVVALRYYSRGKAVAHSLRHQQKVAPYASILSAT